MALGFILWPYFFFYGLALLFQAVRAPTHACACPQSPTLAQAKAQRHAQAKAQMRGHAHVQASEDLPTCTNSCYASVWTGGHMHPQTHTHCRAHVTGMNGSSCAHAQSYAYVHARAQANQQSNCTPPTCPMKKRMHLHMSRHSHAHMQ
jgi:hypothetical protein